MSVFLFVNKTMKPYKKCAWRIKSYKKLEDSLTTTGQYMIKEMDECKNTALRIRKIDFMQCSHHKKNDMSILFSLSLVESATKKEGRMHSIQ